MTNYEKIFYILDKKIYNTTDNLSHIVVSTYYTEIETGNEYVALYKYTNDILVVGPLVRSYKRLLQYSDININEYIKNDILKNKLNTIIHDMV